GSSAGYLDDACDCCGRDGVEFHVLPLPALVAAGIFARGPGHGVLLWDFRPRSRGRMEEDSAVGSNSCSLDQFGANLLLSPTLSSKGGEGEDGRVVCGD